MKTGTRGALVEIVAVLTRNPYRATLTYVKVQAADTPVRYYFSVYNPADGAHERAYDSKSADTYMYPSIDDINIIKTVARDDVAHLTFIARYYIFICAFFFFLVYLIVDRAQRDNVKFRNLDP